MKENKYIIEIPIGDSSGDGHSKCESIVIECNYNTKELEQAYKDSCKLTGLQFNTNTNYTDLELDWKELDKRKICNEYGDSKLSEFVKEILTKHNIIISVENDDFEYEYEQFAILILNFLTLSLKDLQYNIIKPIQRDQFDMGFGYGIFKDN